MVLLYLTKFTVFLFLISFFLLVCRKLRRYAREELLRRRAKVEFYKVRSQLIDWKGKKPPLDDAVGFWVADVEGTVGALPKDIDVALPDHIFMQIERIEKPARICGVKFIPEQKNPDVTPAMEQSYISYDHPTMTWFSLDAPPVDTDDQEEERAPPSVCSSSSSSDNEEDEAQRQQETVLATYLEMLRFKPVLFSPDGAEMQSRKGIVTQYNVQNKTIGIEFKPSATSASTPKNLQTEAPVLEWLPYDHPYLVWIQSDGSYQSEANMAHQHHATRQAAINNTTGSTINMNSSLYNVPSTDRTPAKAAVAVQTWSSPQFKSPSNKTQLNASNADNQTHTRHSSIAKPTPSSSNNTSTKQPTSASKSHHHPPPTSSPAARQTTTTTPKK